MAKFIKTDLEERPEGKIARVTIDNQRKLNTLNSTVIGELDETLASLDNDKDIAVLVLTGAGNKSFVGGADISEMAGLDPMSARTFITNMHHVCRKARFFSCARHCTSQWLLSWGGYGTCRRLRFGHRLQIRAICHAGSAGGNPLCYRCRLAPDYSRG